MIQNTKEFLEKNGLTQAQVARSIGMSSGAISQYLKGEYKGNIENLEKKLSDFIKNYNFKDEKSSKSVEIVETKDLTVAKFIIDEAVIGNELAVIYGTAGCGKTTAIKEYVKTHPEAILIEAIPGMQLSSVLKAICEKASITTLKNSEEMIRAISKEFSRRETILIIDEAENLTTKTLEAIRRIWDFSAVPTVLVGTPALINNLKGRNGELLQLYSRVSGKYEFKGLSESDWINIFGEFSESIKEITTHLRRAMNIYKKAQRFAKADNAPMNLGHIKKASAMVILG